MTELLSSPLFHIYVGSVIILSLNLMALGGGTGAIRLISGGNITPEDRALADNFKKEISEERAETVARFGRAHRNALENIPLFMITAFLMILTGAPLTIASACIGLFTLARLGHSFFYLKGMQPFRSLAFGAGQMAQVGILALIAYQMLGM